MTPHAYYVISTGWDEKQVCCITQDEALEIAEIEKAKGNFCIIIKGNIIWMS